jgi:hypothetical protein
MITAAAEIAAQSWGFWAWEAKEPRDSNPYLEHLHLSPTAQVLADAWYRGWDRADAIRKKRGSRSKPTEYWLWWFTDEHGRRRRTPYRMSRETALARYPDAEPVDGTMELRK